MKKITSIILIFALLFPSFALAFCGFYVAQAGAKLYNQSSQVIVARKGNKTIVTMNNDFSGDVKKFALVVPVPQVLKEKQIRILDHQLFDILDQYSAPRLVEYYDENPCNPRPEVIAFAPRASFDSRAKEEMDDRETKRKTTVKIEAQYKIEEYDILILSATESQGLVDWLTQNDYHIPENAAQVLKPYINNKLKFFVVKVDLSKYQLMGYTKLRPIQIEYDYEKFMLPIRLGMANSTGTQDLIVYTLSSKGRIEVANYRTIPVPTDKNIPVGIKSRFENFYAALFDKAWKKAGRNAAYLEYAWDLSPQQYLKCDPCPAPPPDFYALQRAGAFWTDSPSSSEKIFFTRLHLRYSLDKFPEDLTFIETPNQTNFQARYVMNHPAEGDLSCSAGKEYLKKLKQRQKEEQDNLFELANWTSIYGEALPDPENERNQLPVAYPGKNHPPGGIPTVILILAISAVLIFLAIRFNKQYKPIHRKILYPKQQK